MDSSFKTIDKIMLKLDYIEKSIQEICENLLKENDQESPKLEYSAVDDLIRWMKEGKTYYSVGSDEVNNKLEEARIKFKQQIVEAVKFGLKTFSSEDEAEQTQTAELYYDLNFKDPDIQDQTWLVNKITKKGKKK